MVHVGVINSAHDFVYLPLHHVWKGIRARVGHQGCSRAHSNPIHVRMRYSYYVRSDRRVFINKYSSLFAARVLGVF